MERDAAMGDGNTVLQVAEAADTEPRWLGVVPGSVNSHDHLAVIDAIYEKCRPDGIIPFASRRPGKRSDEPYPRWLMPSLVLTPKERREVLRPILEYEMRQTQYIQINPLKAEALMGKPIQAFKDALAEGRPLYFQVWDQHIKEVNGIGIDLDVGRPDSELTSGLALGLVFDYALTGKLPWPSMAALSGRGVYLFWFLQDGNPHPQAPEATPDNRACWRLCTEELFRRTEKLKADPRAKGLSRWWKRPGTLDTASGNEVRYLTFGENDLLNIPRYRLQGPDGLMTTLGLYHTPLEIYVPPKVLPLAKPGGVSPESWREKIHPVASTKSRKSRNVQPGKGAEPHRRRVLEMELLAQRRGGIREGMRSMTAYYFFEAMRSFLRVVFRSYPDAAERAYAEAYQATGKLNKSFKPPLSPSAVRWACGRLKKGHAAMCVRNATIVRALEVTEEEALALGLRSLVPPELARKIQQAKHERGRERAKRRATVDLLLEEGRLRQVDIGREVGVDRRYVHTRKKWLEARGFLPKPESLFPRPLLMAS